MIRRTKKGKIVYVPPIIMDELEDIKREDGIPVSPVGNSIAFRKMAEYTRVGREAKRIITLNFGKAKPLPPVKSYYPERKQKKMKRGLF